MTDQDLKSQIAEIKKIREQVAASSTVSVANKVLKEIGFLTSKGNIKPIFRGDKKSS